MRRKIYSLLLLVLVAYCVYPINKSEEPNNLGSVAVCEAPTTAATPTSGSYFSNILTTEYWPDRWSCGNWSETEGWMYILSDLSIFLAYLSIPVMLLWYIRKKKLGKLRWIIGLFGAFILLCGFTHLIDVIIFWEPVYRLSGFTKLLTGGVSLITATVLGFVIPKAIEYKSPDELQNEIDDRIKIQNQFQAFIKYSPGAIAMVDRDMKYLLANDNWYKDYELEEVDIIGKSHYEIFPLIEKDEQTIEFHQRGLRGEHLRNDLEVLELDGIKKYVKWQIHPWYTSNNTVGGLMLFSENLTDEVNLEQKLDKKNEDYSMLLDQMSEGFLHGESKFDEHGNPVDWEYLNVNNAFETEVGLKKEHVIGKKVTEVLPKIKEDEANWISVYGNVAKTGISHRIEGYNADLDQYFEASVFSPKKGQFASFFRNITERKKAEQRLKVSEARFRNIFEESMFGIALVGDGGIPFLVNEIFCKIAGYPRKELIQMSFPEFTHPEDIEKDIVEYKKLIKGEINTYTIDKRFIKKDGSISHVKLNVTLVDDVLEKREYALAIVEDITDEVLLSKELRKQKDELFQASETLEEVSRLANIGGWRVDLTLNKVFWSNAVYEIHEEDLEKDIQLETGINYYREDYREVIRGAIEKSIEFQKPWDLDLVIITAKGSQKWVRAVGRPVVEKGIVVGLEGLFQDIHAQKMAEIQLIEGEKRLLEQVDERTKQLETTNKELEAFSYSVSHDLRAPLRAINGFASALSEDHSNTLGESATMYLNRIIANSEKMGKLIDDLLEFSRMNRKKADFAKVDLNKVCHKIVDEIFYDSKNNVRVGELPIIPGDTEMLNQVFTNLISNALKYSSKIENQKVTIASKEEERHWVISVTDNGAGFDMEYAGKLFQVFQRLHSESEFEGTGVGLALCSKIVKAHGGDIYAESEKGIKTTFYVKLKKENELDK